MVKVKSQNYGVGGYVSIENWANQNIHTMDFQVAKNSVDKCGDEVVAKLSEVAENDYNLNIPSYVDTFVEEAPIDLDEVVNEIQKIDSEMVDVDKKITDYCEELDINSPFRDEL